MEYQKNPVRCGNCGSICEPPFTHRERIEEDIVYVKFECQWCGGGLEDPRLFDKIMPFVCESCQEACSSECKCWCHE